jgi:hypothetical protein
MDGKLRGRRRSSFLGAVQKCHSMFRVGRYPPSGLSRTTGSPTASRDAIVTPTYPSHMAYACEITRSGGRVWDLAHGPGMQELGHALKGGSLLAYGTGPAIQDQLKVPALLAEGDKRTRRE